MKTIFLTLMTLVFCSTVNAQTPEEKPLSHYLATATANVFNRLKTVGAYTTWISKRVPDNQMKDFKAYLKTQGLKSTTQFPKMTAENDKVCFDKDHCMTYTNDSLTINGVAFKVENKPFTQVVSDVCSKIGCSSTKTASFSIIPQADASYDNNSSQNGKRQKRWTLAGLIAGGAIGYFAGGKSAEGLLGGAIVGGIGGYVLSEEDRYACNGNCPTSCAGNSCYMNPSRPQPQPYNYYGQQRPPYQMPQNVFYQIHGQYQPPCHHQTQPTYPYPMTELEIELQRRQATPVYCTNVAQPCTQAQPYNPGGCQYAQNNLGAPADVRAVQSEPKKMSPAPKK